MHADKCRYLNSGIASAFIGIHLRLLFFLGVVARELLARERLPLFFGTQVLPGAPSVFRHWCERLLRISPNRPGAPGRFSIVVPS